MKVSLKQIQAYTSEMIAEVQQICERHNIVYFLGYGSVIGAVRHHGPIPWDSDMDIIVPINQIDKFLDVARKEMSDKFYIDYYDTNPKCQALFPRIGLRGYSTRTLHIDVFKLIGSPTDKNLQKKMRKKLKLYTNLMKAKQRGSLYYRNSFDKILLPLYKVILFPLSKKKIIDKYEALCNKYSYEDSDFVLNANEGYEGKGILPKSIYGNGVKVDYDDVLLMIPSEYDKYLSHFYGDYMKLPDEKDRISKNIFNIQEIYKN